jgi:hypothetical protein
MNHLLRIATILLAIPWCLAASPRATGSSVTVVTHGFDLWADLFPGWSGGPLRDLGLALYDYWATQPGGAVEYLYEPATMGLTTLRGLPTNENKILVFDWSSDSNDTQAGYDEGAGDVMFAVLKQYDLLNSDYLHLIGHSRGGVVSTQAARRILHYGHRLDQLTFLDVEEGPYPYNEAGPGRAWEGIGFVDNYYGNGGLIDVGLGGNRINGAYNVYKDVSHSAFPDWYMGTASAPDATKGGFYWRVANPAERPAATGDRTPLAAPPDVINGNFSYGISINDKVAGWWYHGGGGGGHVDLITVEDFDLELDYDDASKRHSWLYAPEDVYKLEFQARIGGSILNDDEFWITLQRYDNFSRRVSPFSVDSSRPLQWYAVDIPDFADSVFRFTFGIEAPGQLNVVDSQVEIDNVRFVRYSAADFDRDGSVDRDDLATWRANFGRTGATRAQGDADGDGDVDGADFLAWQRQLGPASAVVASSAHKRGAVPEPAAGLLAIPVSAGWLLRPRRFVRGTGL